MWFPMAGTHDFFASHPMTFNHENRTSFSRRIDPWNDPAGFISDPSLADCPILPIIKSSLKTYDIMDVKSL